MRILEFIHDCDHPRITNLDLWIRENKFDISMKIKVFEAFIPPDFESFDLLILHGGAQHLWDKQAAPWLYQEIEFVRRTLEQKKPVIGFCLGSQIIAEVLGGKVFKTPEKEVGWYKISIRENGKEHMLLGGLEEGFISFMWHSDHYDISDACVSLGYTRAAPHQIIIGKDVPVLGFQFHPEYTKENLYTYFTTCYEEMADLKSEIGKPEVLIRELEGMPETYILFKQLMNNSINWIKQKI